MRSARVDSVHVDKLRVITVDESTKSDSIFETRREVGYAHERILFQALLAPLEQGFLSLDCVEMKKVK